MEGNSEGEERGGESHSACTLIYVYIFNGANRGSYIQLACTIALYVFISLISKEKCLCN